MMTNTQHMTRPIGWRLRLLRPLAILAMIAGTLAPRTAMAQLDKPCECAQRWEDGAHWNPNGTVDETPNAPEAQGIIRCGSSAETQSQIEPHGCLYNPAEFPINVGGGGCVEPSSGNMVTVTGPTAGQPIIWLQFDIRPNAGTFQIQLNDNSGDNIGWALYYSNNPTAGVLLGGNNMTTDSLGGNCASLSFATCGVESASTWNTLPVPAFNQPTNYYLAIWDQDADGNLSVSNFKARFGCGDADVFLCNLQLGDVSLVCNNNGTYSVELPIMGINGSYVGYDVNAVPQTSAPVCLTNNASSTPVTSGTIIMHYPSSVSNWNITVSAQDNPAACIDPLNVGDCVASISGSAPSAANASATGGMLDCTNTSVQLDGSTTTQGASYSWTGPNNFTSTDEDPSVSVAGTYTFTVNNGLGCSASATAVVEQDITTPGAQATGGTLTCTSLSVQLQGSGNGSYSWTGPNSFTSSEQNPTVSVAGTYVLTVTGANGCTSTAQAVVELDNAAPGAQATGGTLTCTTLSVQLGGIGNGSYNWTGPNSFTSNAQNPTVTVAGTYVLTVTGENGCTSTAQAVVELDNAAPGAQATGGTLTCTTLSVQLGGSGNGSFAWSGPNSFTSSEQNPTVTVAGTYVLTVTGTNGCTSTAQAVVELDNAAPGAQATGGTLTCTTLSVQLGGIGNGSYSWTGPNSFTSNAQNPTVTVAGTYVLTVTGANGCTSTAQAVVEQDSNVPGAQATGGTLTCTTLSVQLGGSGNGSYSWTGPNSFTSNAQNPTVSVAGTYVLTVTGANGCTSTAQAVVELDNAAPGAQATGGTLTCTTLSVQLGGIGNGSFAWSGPNSFTSSEQNPTVTVAGTYVLTVTGANGCTSTAQAVVELDNAAPGAQATGGTLTCTTLSVQLGGIGNGSYSWTGPNSFTSNAQNPTVTVAGTYVLTVTGANGCTSTAEAVVLADTDVPDAFIGFFFPLDCNTLSTNITGNSTVNGSTFAWSGPNNFASTSQTINVSAPGTYVLTVTAPNGCSASTQATLEQDTTLPTAIATGGFITCDNTTVQLSGLGNGTISWTGPNGFTSNAPNPIVSEGGTYVLTVIGDNGCSNTDEAVVELLNTGLELTAQGGKVPCDGSGVTISANAPGEVTYTWMGPNGFTASGSSVVVFVEGVYTVEAVNENGCSAMDEVSVGKELCDECPPIIIECPPTKTVECGISLEPDDIGYPLFRKDPNCPPIIYATYYDITLGYCPRTVTRYWTLADNTGDTAHCVQEFIIVDTQAPVIMNVPQDKQVECDQVPEADGEVFAEDNCKGSLDVYTMDAVKPGGCEGNYIIVRTYWAVDDCGNMGTATQTIQVMDTTPPVIMCNITDPEVEVNCKYLPKPAECKAQDNCDQDVKVEVSDEFGWDDLQKHCQLVRTYSATDDCGNTSTVQHVIPVTEDCCKGLDEKAMVVSVMPNPFTERCEIMFVAPESGAASVTIYDLSGRVVAELLSSGVVEGQTLRVPFAPGSVGSGVYQYRVTIGERMVTGRMIME